MRDHAAAAGPSRRFVVEALDAEDVVDVPVGEDRGVHRRRRPAAHAAVHLRGELRRAGVDERQPALAGDGDDVGEAGDEGDAGRDLLQLNSGVKGCCTRAEIAPFQYCSATSAMLPIEGS